MTRPRTRGRRVRLRSLFADPTFELPGTTGLYELQQLIAAIKQLPEGQQQQLYRSLGGKK